MNSNHLRHHHPNLKADWRSQPVRLRVVPEQSDCLWPMEHSNRRWRFGPSAAAPNLHHPERVRRKLEPELRLPNCRPTLPAQARDWLIVARTTNLVQARPA